MLVVQAGDDAEAFLDDLRARFTGADVGALLGAGGVQGLVAAVDTLQRAGAELLTGGEAIEGQGCRFQNTLLRTSGAAFLADPEGLQTEAFGNSNLIVVATDAAEMERIAERLEGNLTGSVY